MTSEQLTSNDRSHLESLQDNKTRLGPMIGAVVTANGELDLSHAAWIKPKDESLEQIEQAPPSTLEHAAQLGLDEPALKTLVGTLRRYTKPKERRMVLGGTIRKLAGANPDINVGQEELLAVVRTYRKETIRHQEAGEIVHYHQTPLSNLREIVAQGALQSHDTLKARGIAPGSSGSRPDVVQFTRDEYDQAGNLTRAGLVDPHSLGVGGGVALIFGESIMDAPDYDSLGTYPNVPGISLNELKAVAVDRPEDIEDVRSTLASQGIETDVVSREDWTNLHLPK